MDDEGVSNYTVATCPAPEFIAYVHASAFCKNNLRRWKREKNGITVHNKKTDNIFLSIKILQIYVRIYVLFNVTEVGLYRTSLAFLIQIFCLWKYVYVHYIGSCIASKVPLYNTFTLTLSAYQLKAK